MNRGWDEEYRRAVDDLVSRGMMPERPPGLETTDRGLKNIGFYDWPFWERLKQDPRRAIVVAGTNGKGSVCATLEALFRSTGERVGVYTSPHLVEHTERIRIDGNDISRADFVRAFEAVEARSGEKLSHFEAITLMAVWAFCSGEMGPPVDRLILEVGLGGTWDSTNAVPHGMAVICKLGFDHQNLLGSTLAEIAENKFGIIHPRSEFLREGMTVVHGVLPAEVIALANAKRENTGSRWIEAPLFESLAVSQPAGPDRPEPSFFMKTPWGRQAVSLPGRRGAENTSLALAVFEACGYDPGKSLQALGQVRWPGRMEKYFHAKMGRYLFLSGDHNPQGMASLVEVLSHYPRRWLHLLLGIGRDKDLDGMMIQVNAIQDMHLYFTETPFKGLTVQDYGQWLERAEGAWSDPLEALEQVCKRAAPDDMVLVSGSLYLVGAIRT